MIDSDFFYKKFPGLEFSFQSLNALANFIAHRFLKVLDFHVIYFNIDSDLNS